MRLKHSTARDRTASHPESATRTAERIIRLLEDSRAVTHLHTYEHFRRSLAIWHAVLYGMEMGPWLELCAGMERGLKPLAQALGLLVAEAQNNYVDTLGIIYMMLSEGEKRLGQYFTPNSVTRVMNQLALGDIFEHFTPPEPDAPPLRYLEPSCGSGAIILAAAEIIEILVPGSILRGHVLFYGIDLDPLCIMMAQINMVLHQIGCVVRAETNSTEPLTAVATTPTSPEALVFRPAKIVLGNTLTQETHELFGQETPWVPVFLAPPLTQLPPLSKQDQEPGPVPQQATPVAQNEQECLQSADPPIARTSKNTDCFAQSSPGSSILGVSKPVIGMPEMQEETKDRDLEHLQPPMQSHAILPESRVDGGTTLSTRERREAKPEGEGGKAHIVSSETAQSRQEGVFTPPKTGQGRERKRQQPTQHSFIQLNLFTPE